MGQEAAAAGSLGWEVAASVVVLAREGATAAAGAEGLVVAEVEMAAAAREAAAKAEGLVVAEVEVAGRGRTLPCKAGAPAARCCTSQLGCRCSPSGRYHYSGWTAPAHERPRRGHAPWQ